MLGNHASRPTGVALAAATMALSCMAATHAQQHRQTDLEFTRERAQLQAVEQRIASLRQRLHRKAGEVSHAGAQEHVLLGRDSAPPPGDSGPGTVAAAVPAAQPEKHTPETLRHRDRAASTGDIRSLDARLDAAAGQARSLGERINRPDFGAGLRKLGMELDDIEAGVGTIEDERRRESKD